MVGLLSFIQPVPSTKKRKGKRGGRGLHKSTASITFTTMKPRCFQQMLIHSQTKMCPSTEQYGKTEFMQPTSNSMGKALLSTIQ